MISHDTGIDNIMNVKSQKSTSYCVSKRAVCVKRFSLIGEEPTASVEMQRSGLTTDMLFGALSRFRKSTSPFIGFI